MGRRPCPVLCTWCACHRRAAAEWGSLAANINDSERKRGKEGECRGGVPCQLAVATPAHFWGSRLCWDVAAAAAGQAVVAHLLKEGYFSNICWRQHSGGPPGTEQGRTRQEPALGLAGRNPQYRKA